MNPPTSTAAPRDNVDSGTQTQDPKRRLGEHTGAGELPIMKK